MKDDQSVTQSEKAGACLPATPEESFVRALYASVDEAIASGLVRLLKDDGIVPSCRLGCCSCCRFPILISIAEARTLAHFVKRTFSLEQIESLRIRTRQWHQWDDALRAGSSSDDLPGQPDAFSRKMSCPILVDEACSAYDVRPLVCRSHFVRSHPLSCKEAINTQSVGNPPQVIESIKAATQSYTMSVKHCVEKTGLDYCRTMTLLPHGLATEMGWDFDKEQ
jgi:Fe-S-cluster containining protein